MKLGLLNIAQRICAAMVAAGVLHMAPAWARDDALWSASNEERDKVVATLENLVNIETPSRHEAGLREAGKVLAARLEALGARVERIAATTPPAQGEHIVGHLQGNGKARLLLIAHMDTIYPVGTLAKRPFRIDEGKAYGPGIADDKSGIAVILHALAALKKVGYRDYGRITILFNSDEEITSVDSGKLIMRLAGDTDVALSFEPSTVGDEYTTLATAGNGEAIVTVKGRSAHAGVEPERGRNALVEASDVVLRTADLDDPQQRFRFTWTQMSSGKVRNQVPDEATISADVRYLAPWILDGKLRQLRERLEQRRIPETDVDLKFVMGRPAFSADAVSRRLIEHGVAVYREIGGVLHIAPNTGGGTDAGYVQSAGRPVMEGLGLPGFGYHSSKEEYVAIDRIPARIYLAARLIQDISSGRVDLSEGKASK